MTFFGPGGGTGSLHHPVIGGSGGSTGDDSNGGRKAYGSGEVCCWVAQSRRRLNIHRSYLDPSPEGGGWPPMVVRGIMDCSSRTGTIQSVWPSRRGLSVY